MYTFATEESKKPPCQHHPMTAFPKLEDENRRESSQLPIVPVVKEQKPKKVERSQNACPDHIPCHAMPCLTIPCNRSSLFPLMNYYNENKKRDQPMFMKQLSKPAAI